MDSSFFWGVVGWGGGLEEIAWRKRDQPATNGRHKKETLSVFLSSRTNRSLLFPLPPHSPAPPRFLRIVRVADGLERVGSPFAQGFFLFNSFLRTRRRRCLVSAPASLHSHPVFPPSQEKKNLGSKLAKRKPKTKTQKKERRLFHRDARRISENPTPEKWPENNDNNKNNNATPLDSFRRWSASHRRLLECFPL